jgi:hypothetical protein
VVDRLRKVIIPVTAVVLMTGSVLGFIYFTKQVQVQVTTMNTIGPIRMLHSGELIDSSMLRVVPIAQVAHRHDALLDMDAMIGKTVIVPISKDEEIVSWKISDKKLVPGQGERYVSFKTDSVANVNNMVRKGDRVDVWVEFDNPKLIKTGSGVTWSVGAVKIIDNLMVSSVKSAEGVEVADTGILESMIQSDQAQLSNARSKAIGKPEQNTYIMNDSLYEAFALGNIGGKIKLVLPNLTSPNNEAAKITELFITLRVADAFTKAKPQVTINGELKQKDINGSEVPNTSGDGETKQNSNPLPKATEVK